MSNGIAFRNSAIFDTYCTPLAPANAMVTPHNTHTSRKGQSARFGFHPEPAQDVIGGEECAHREPADLQ